MTETRSLGARGEALAAEYLIEQGYRVVARNHRSRLGELDLIAEDGPETVFVEVKSRLGGEETSPEEAVGPAKVARVVRLAEAYLADAERLDCMWRIDAIAVLLDPAGRLIRLDHIRNAVY